MELDRITIKGEGFVLVPTHIFQELLEGIEDKEDIEAIEQSAGAQTISGDVVHRIILNGENPIKVFREYRGLNMAELAIKANISEAYISMIESGKRVGTTKVLKKIAEILLISLDDIA